MFPSGLFCLLAIAMLSVTLGPGAALALGETGNVCLRDFRPGGVCTANDVRFEALSVISVIEDCASGTPGETEVSFEALVSSAGSPDRYDIGLFLALDGGSARDGDSCLHDFLDPPLTATPTYVEEDPMLDGPGPMGEDTILNGPWWDGDTDADMCGDIESNSRVKKDLQSIRLKCVDNSGDGSADVSVCTSWDNNANTACNSVVEAFPGTNSKCSCTTVELGIAPAPEITVVKDPPLQNIPAGGTASFTITVTSNTHLTNVMPTDPLCNTAIVGPMGDTNNDSVLTPDETWTYTCTTTGVMADFTNTATVNATSPNGPVEDSDDADVVVSSATMTLEKTGAWNDANMDGFAQVGETIDYSFTVTNTGTIALTNVAVTDPMVSPITCPSGNPIPVLAVATMETCTGSYTILQADIDAGEKVNTATATSNETPPEMDTTEVRLPAPGMTLVKSGAWDDANMDGVAQAGEMIDYSFTVTNTGTIALTNVSVTDPMVAPITCPSGNPIPSLGVGAMETCTGSHTIVQADVDAGEKINTATATSDETPPEMDTTTVTLPANAAMTLMKTGVFNDESMDGSAQAGETISYSFVVTNTGATTLTNVAVTDLMVAPITCPSGNPIPSLGVGAMETCTGSYTILQADVDEGEKVNTATATSDQTPPEMDTTTVPLPANAALTLAKTGVWNDANMDGVTQVGEMIDYSFTVTNTGATTLTNIAVTDPMVAPITCPSGNPIPSLGVGAMETCTGSYTIVQADVDAGQKVNTATATSNETPPEMDTETTPFGAASPVIGVAKVLVSLTDLGGGQYNVAFSYLVENLGNVPLTNVQVTDDLTATFPAPVTFAIQSGPTAGGTLTANPGFNGAGDQSLLDAGASSLTVGANATVSVTVLINLNEATGPFVNTAIASGDDPTGTPVTDTSDDGTDPDPDGDGNPDETGENDPTPIVIPLVREPVEIPTLSMAGLLVFLLALIGAVFVTRHRRVPARGD